MTENEKEKLEKIRLKIEQMKEQEKAIITKDKKRQHKENTRRLIQNGTLAEKYLGCENMQPEEFEKILKTIVNMPNDKNIQI